MIKDPMDKKLLQQAIKVLRNLNTKFYEDSSKKKPLLEDEQESTVYLQFTLKKIPQCKSIKMIKMNLPHSLVKNDSEVCLIAGDLDKKNHKAEIEPDVLHYKELLKKHGINNISEVVTLRQLRTEYKPYEAKQKLLAAYDVFLTDRKITECLPKVLGRHFFKKRKFPIQITLSTPNLKQQVEKALSTKVFYLTGLGNSCNSEVAYLDMSDTEISENIIAMAKAFCEALPGSWDNVMGIYLKTALSKAVPLYMSYDDPTEICLKEEKQVNAFTIDELSTNPEEKLVKVYADGTVQTVRKKRMAKVETCETANSGENLEKKKMKKGNIDDDSADNFVNHPHSNEEATIVKKKSKREKKEKVMLEQEVESSLCIIDNKGETSDISGDVKKKRKKRGTIVDDSILNLVDTHLIGETSDISGDVKKKKKKKGTIVDDSIHNLVDKDETSDISVDIEKKKKKKSTIVDDSVHNLVNKEKTTQIKKRPKSEKREKSILEKETESSVCSTGGKDKKRKRKSIGAFVQ